MSDMKRILIADDEPGIVRLLKDFFEIQDYQVIEAKNGLEVLGQLNREPDIILLDVNMPMLDGFEVCGGGPPSKRGTKEDRPGG